MTGAGQALPPVRILRIRTLTGGNALRRRVAAVLAREIRTVVEAGVIIQDLAAPERTRRLDYGDVQVLVGTVNEGRLVAKALGRLGVPCVAFKQKGLFQSDEARDLLDLLRAVERPNDPGRRARALLTPFFGYRLADLDGLAAMTEDHPVVQKLQDWHQLGRQRQFPLMLEAILERSGLIRRLRLTTGNERALTNFLHLTELLTAAGSHGAADLRGPGAPAEPLGREARNCPPGRTPSCSGWRARTRPCRSSPSMPARAWRPASSPCSPSAPAGRPPCTGSTRMAAAATPWARRARPASARPSGPRRTANRSG